jgi:uroporphyrinogen-III synthase
VVRRVAITRQPADLPRQAAVLTARGWEVVALPVTRHLPASPDEQQRLAEAVAHLTSFDAIVLASRRAVQSLLDALGGVFPERTPPIWAVGPATVEALRAHGVRAHIPSRSDASSLASAVLTQGGCQRVLMPRADGGRDEAVDLLTAAGIWVEAIAVYRTEARLADDPELQPGLDALIGGGIDAVACFAPSQAIALAQLCAGRGRPLSTLASTRLVAIGETTAAALRGAGITPAAVAATPTPESMADALGSVYPPAS